MENDGLKVVLLSGEEPLNIITIKVDSKIFNDMKTNGLLDKNNLAIIDLKSSNLIFKKDLISIAKTIHFIQLTFTNNNFLYNLEKELYKGI